MITLEDKFNLFSKIVYEEAEEGIKKVTIEYEKQEKELIEKEKKICEEKERAASLEAERKANIKYSEIIAKGKFEKQQQVLRLKETLINETVEEIKNKLIIYTKTPDYKEYLKNLIKSTIETVDNGNYFLYVTEMDKDKYFEDIRSTISSFEKGNIIINTINNNIIGGIILENEERKFRINNSLSSMLEELKQKIGIKLMEKLN